MQIHKVTEIYKNLELTVQNKEWIDAHSEEDVKLVTDARDVTLNLISQVAVFIDLFHQYVDLVQGNAIFSQETNADSSNDGEVSPTQTSPAPANRAERRAGKTPLDIVKDKK
jgi:ferric-dicitrate binding protein FerR (iron transport regulator)